MRNEEKVFENFQSILDESDILLEVFRYKGRTCGKIKCLKHNIIYDTRKDRYQKGYRCPQCEIDKKTNKYNSKIKSIGWKAIEDYVDRETEIKHLCLNCGNIRYYKPKNLLKNPTKCYCQPHGLHSDSEKVIKIKQWAKENKYFLIDIQRKTEDKETTIYYICPKHPQKIRSKKFKHILIDSKCPECQNEKQSISADEMKSRLKDKNIIKVVKKKMYYNKYKFFVVLRCCKCGEIFEKELNYYRKNNSLVCKKCTCSKGELKIEKYLKQNNINFKEQYKFNNCRSKKPLPFDFYIPSLNMVIEYQGKQHYKPVDYFGGEKSFQIQQRNDNIKRKYCENNNIKLLEIPYTEYDNIEEILKKELSI